MNQEIIFVEREQWDSLRQGVVCMAMVNGFQVFCCVRGETLSQRFGEMTKSEQYVELFKQYRWDLEDELQQLIENDEVDADGWIII